MINKDCLLIKTGTHNQ